ncbi:Dnaj homolog subfamily b member 5 [Phtheirospermum japonicum]|uniref:Dnaj homolog subfamily b member 5 n=1 Tax=Phtheirospermum japonicum TaxID=374723 RepID=A0A830CH37_9LAMI|nr:Dnaj homolog subfamily b member 5 [Phtheirospermum japonicum]
MDCNKDEAVKAKEVAETKLLEKDIPGAKKFALKAQGLFPKLDGLSQFLEIVDVHVAHEKKIKGEVDYYRILGVDPFANEDVLKKHYKRMALSLHPDKNKSVGADGAFKILSQAWSVLSDVDQRTAYNSRLSNVRAPNEATCKYTRPRTQGPFASGAYVPSNPVPPTINQHIPSRNPLNTIPSYQQQQTRVRPPFHHQYAPFIRPQTFWTTCDRCSMHYEYLKVYLNQNLLCRGCQKPFLATEMPHAPKANNHSYQQQHVFAGSPSVPSGEHLKSSTIPEEMKAASASNSVDGLYREKQPVKKRRKNSHAGDQMSGVKKASAKLNGNFGAKRESISSVKELSQAEIRSMLARKAKTGILGLIKECEAEESKKSSQKVEIKKDAIKTEQSGDVLIRDTKNTLPPNKSTLEETDDIDVNADETVSMMVPDANFHNFDDDRIEESFSENQIWAAYDDDDGMPRYYAMVHHVISRKPFKMQISWLNSKSTSEFGSLEWIGSGFTKTSGDYRVGKCEVSRRLNSFSHPVKWKKGPRGIIQIFPTKGDVWAVYRNWSPDWVEATSDEMIHKYDVVVVLEDYNEDVGVSIAPLVKVAGFTSVFNLDQRGTHTIPREEMFRFSHQVPFHILNGLEAENAPKGCYELDPAALPLELLKVITDAEAAEERVSEHPVMLSGSDEAVRHAAFQKINGVEEGKNILTYSRRKKRKEDGKVCSRFMTLKI